MESKVQKALRIVGGGLLELWTITLLLDVVYTFKEILYDNFGLSFVLAAVRLVVVILLQIYTIRVFKNSPKSRMGLTIAMFVLMIFGGSSPTYGIYYYGLLAYLGLMIYEIMNKKSNRNLSLTKSIVATVLLVALQLVGSCIVAPTHTPDWIYFLQAMAQEGSAEDILWTLSLLRPLMTFLASAVIGAYAIVGSVQAKKAVPAEVASAPAVEAPAEAVETVEEPKATDAE